MDPDSCITIEIASEKHLVFTQLISDTMESSAKARGTGISKRSPDLLKNYIEKGNAVIAVHTNGEWAGFGYVAVWDSGRFVSNSGLIVAPQFRDHGIAKAIKTKLFELCQLRYPDADIIGLTTSPAVMKINSEQGFYATSFSEMPREEKFWDGCKSCINHDILQRTERKYCLCTAMRYTKHVMAKNQTVPQGN